MNAAQGGPDRRGMLLVVAGPSGVGKGTLIRELLRRHPQVQWSVSCTTRQPRPGERNGVDYHFLTEEQFTRMREHGELLEWALVHGTDRYGTPRRPVEEALQAGRDVVMEIDYQGARSVRARLPEAVMVFVAPPSAGAMRQRLAARNTEDASSLERRMRSAAVEFAHMGMFEYVLVNDDLQQACSDLEAIYLAERLHSRRCGWRDLQARLLAELEEQQW